MHRQPDGFPGGVLHALALGLFAPCYLAQELSDMSLLQTSLTVEKSPPVNSMLAVLSSGAPAHDKATACTRLTRSIESRSFDLANPEVIEPIVQAIVKHVDDRNVVTACFGALQSFNPTFNRAKTLLVNGGTHIPLAVNAVLAHYPHDRDMQKDCLLYVAMFSTYVACEVQPPYQEAGCLDRVWDALDYFKGPDYTDVQMSAWQGFSDHSGCRAGAEAIANHGGPKMGIPRLVQALKEAVGNQYHPDMMHGGSVINLQYEIMAVANGVLSHANDTNGFLDTFIREGYPQAVLASMRDMPEERSTNDRGCAALSMLMQNAASLEALKDLGAVDLVAAAMERFKAPDHRRLANKDFGNMYPVLPYCDSVLRNFATASAANLDTMLRLGVLETYESMRSDLKFWMRDMGKLPKLLRARKQEQGA